MTLNGDRWLFKCLLTVVAYVIVAVVGIEFLPSSDMRFWHVRAIMFQSLGWCIIVHLGIIFGFLFMRKWRRFVFASCAGTD